MCLFFLSLRDIVYLIIILSYHYTVQVCASFLLKNPIFQHFSDVLGSAQTLLLILNNFFQLYLFFYSFFA